MTIDKISFRLPTELKESLEVMAADRNRTISGELNAMIQVEVRKFAKEYAERDLTLDLPLKAK